MYIVGEEEIDALAKLIRSGKLFRYGVGGECDRFEARYADHLANQQRISGSSIYPAIQNIILACRALGLGTVITTNHILYEDEVKAVLGMPDSAATFALMPIGYPTGKYGPLTRKPVAEVTYADAWGTAWPAAAGGDHAT